MMPMMWRLYVPHALVALNLLLAGGLTALWVGPDGQLRPTDWQPPAAHPVDVSAFALPYARPAPIDLALYMETLDKPVFSPSRRPPPPPKPVEPVKPDPFSDVHLFGVFGSGEWGGVLARIESKVQVVKIGEAIGVWTLKEIKGREVTFAGVEGTKTLMLIQAKNLGGPMAGAAPPPVPAAVNTGPLPSGYSSVEEERRERLKAINAVRARAGLPPRTE